MGRHKNWLYRFVRRYLRDAEESYDVVQDAFVSAWEALPRYDVNRPFDVWLRRIALNKCRDRARKDFVRRRLFRLTGASEEETEAAPAHEPFPEEQAATREALARVEAAIAKLPRGLKEPLMLTALEGLSHAEAGAVLGLNAKAVEMRVYRARKQLAEELDPSLLADIAER
jgi:RNA polymerase sigma-70 factor (ECF subfamily)